MLRVGLTGGIGSGKSTVSRRLVEHGALLIDADVIAREVVEVGTDGLAAVRERFGDEVLGPGGALDRPALGRLVFGDEAARADLNALLHPLILEETQNRFDAAPDDAIVVHDMPLLVELDRGATYHLTIVVGAAADVRLRRLIEDRGMSEDDARARIAAQASDEQRRAAADVWLDNEGTVEEVLRQVDALWQDRLVPFERNLREGTPARDGVRSPDGRRATPGPDLAARILERLRHQVERAGLAQDVVAYEHLELTAGAAGTGDCDLRVSVADRGLLSRPELETTLAAAGFVRSSAASREAGADPSLGAGATYRGADPDHVVTLHVAVAHTPPDAG